VKKVFIGGFFLWLLFKGGQKAVNYITGNIEVDVAISKPQIVNWTVLTDITLTVTNNNVAGVEITGLSGGKLFYGQYELGDINLPPYQVFTLGGNDTVEIPVTVTTNAATALTAAASLLLDNSWFNVIRIEGDLQTSAGNFDISQNISLAE
jgi:hypothetical protein